MFQRKASKTKMVAMQLCTDEGAFIGNVDEADVAKIATRQSGAFISVHCAIRLDAMFAGQYEIHRTKLVEASSIDHHQVFLKRLKPWR